MDPELIDRIAAIPTPLARKILRAFVRGREAEGWVRLGNALGGLPFRPDEDPELAERALDQLDLLVSPDEGDDSDTVTLLDRR